MTVRLRHHGDVSVYVCETAIWDDKIVDRWDRVASDFGSLAVQAVSSPARDVGAEGWPDKLVSDHLPSAFNSWMSQAMNGVENAASP